jgi:branched-chain amino acid transport system substrate-binding protein
MQNHDGAIGRPRRSRRWAAGATALLLLGSAAACGGDDEGDGDGAAPAATSTTTAGDATGTTAAPAEGDDVLGPEDPASGEPLRIGFITDGQNAATDQSIELDVAEATVEFLNERRAGYAGRPIELVICEAQLDPGRGADCANQMVEEGVPVVAIGTTGVVESVWTPLHEAGVPTMFFAASGDTVLGDTENTFAVSNPQAGNISLPITVAEENDLDKVTVIAIDVPAAYAGYEGSGAEAFEDAGIELEVVRIAAGTADMTPQLQPVFAGDPGVIHIIGNDAFCISAYQAMIALGFDGPQTGITQCVTDATRQAIPGDFLEGMNIASAAPVGVEDESTLLYRTVMDTYADVDIDTSRIAGVGTFLVLNALDVGLEGLEGEVTPESVIATLRSMEEADLPGGGGIRFRCNGNALPGLPAVCSSGGVSGVLDDTGNVSVFVASDAEPIPD